MAESARYALLRNLLRDKILSGDYEPGARFFSQNELMKKYGLSFSTVVRALDELVREGHLVRQQGKGTFVASVTPPNPAAEPVKQRDITIYAPWGMGHSGGNSYGSLDLPAFLEQLEALKPENMLFRVVPHPTSADELDRLLFAKAPPDAVVSLYPPPGHAATLNQLSKHCPSLLISSTEYPAPSVQTDYAEAARLATRHLCTAGHSRIGLICPSGPGSIAADCLAGFTAEMRAVQKTFRESQVVQAPADDPTGYHATLSLMDTNTDQRITAIIAAGTATLAGVRFALGSMGLTIGRTISVIWIQDYPQIQAGSADVTHTEFPVSVMAAATIRSLLTIVSGGKPSAVSIPPQLIHYGSVSAPDAALG